MPILQVHVFVFGRVQGVGYRFFVSSAANRNKLTGFVRNVPDGSVEIVAVGEKEKLNDFLAMLEKGTWLARVDHVVSDWMESYESFSKFEIRF
ncbi:MAG: acylphosphatase [Candidatus Diapherotrites archaeon]|uniref:acylphosphatase n=1 Tax=Candidatus Iainarchaeum sp. TaxID=3101447 RepID=A0A8T4L568_9ARCH|nr:acylphosphatase [Candidatus Diapherotrites archaeon]